MKIFDIINETTTSGSIASATSAVGGIQKRNPDGTAVNALDQDKNIFGTKKKKKNESAS